MSSLRLLVLCALLLASCSRAQRSSAPRLRARLPEGVVARVGSEQITRGTVQRIAKAEHVTPQIARDRAVTDALFATAARATFRAGSLLPVLERAANARALLLGLQADALGLGPPTDAEIAELTQLRWREFDRPESARTTHAVALVSKPEDDARAREVAWKIYQAVRHVQDPQEFMRLAQAVPHDGIQVRVERLPAVTLDGRVLDPDRPTRGSDQRFDPAFARAAMQLAAGEVSEPVRSAFGYHVILCEARLPELRVPLEQRRVLLRDEVVKGRAERAKQELLARLASAHAIQVSRASEDLTARVAIREAAREGE